MITSRSALLGGASLVILGLSALAAQADGAIKVNYATAPSTLDPAWACGLPELSFLQNFYVRLVQPAVVDAGNGFKTTDFGKYEPWLAESWTISEDQKTYTFKLKSGFKFASGAAVDAAAVKYSLERASKMAGCGNYIVNDGFTAPSLYESIEATDPTTLVIKLTHPNANTLQALSTPSAGIVDAAVVEANGGVEAGKPNEYMASHVTASGAFDLTAYSPNQSAKLTRNPNYGDQAAVSEAIDVNWISAPPTLLLQARSGQVDFTFGLAKQAANSMKEQAGIKVLAFNNPFSLQILMPNSKAPWDNVKVREAVALSIPYQDIIAKVAFGWGTPYYGPIMPSLPGFDAAKSAPLTPDMDKAKALMAESGVSLPVNVEMVLQEGDAVQEQVATILQGIWGELGINVTTKVLPGAEYQDVTQAHKAQTFMRVDGPGVFDAGYYLGYDMVCGGGFNLTEACVPEADEKLKTLRSSSDAAERAKLIGEITDLWRASYPKIPVYEDQPVVVLSDAVKNFTFSPLPDMRGWGK